MKSIFILFLVVFCCQFGLAQSKSVVMTVKTVIEIIPEEAHTELTTIDENNRESTKKLPHLFLSTEQHEKMLQQEISSITSKGFTVISSTQFSYGGSKQKFYYFTRYIFTEPAKK